MAWMTVEAAAGIVAGIVASSIVLIGFGLDSVIEFFAAAVVVWQLRGTVSGERDSRALRLIGGTFFALAAHLAVESVAPGAEVRVLRRLRRHAGEDLYSRSDPPPGRRRPQPRRACPAEPAG